MKSSTGLALHFMRKGLPRRSWACPVAQRGVLNGEGASATTAPKCTKVLGAALRKQNLAGHSRFLPHTQHGACFLTLKPHTWMFSGRCEGYSGGAPGLCGGAQAPSAGSSSTSEKSSSPPYSSAAFAARLMMPTTSPMSRRHGAQAFYTLCSNPTELRWTAPSPQRVFS